MADFEATVLGRCILAILIAITAWGALWPRGQWRVLTAWSRRDPDAGAPSPLTVTALRLISIGALAVVVAVGVTTWQSTLPAPTTATTRAVTIWGEPAPTLVNRIYRSVDSPPGGLVAQPVLKFEKVDGSARTPSYLWSLPEFQRPGAQIGDGYLGTTAPVGVSSLDSADLVVQVSGDIRCTPQSVVVLESSTRVVIGVYYGQPNPPGSNNAAHVTDCTISPPASKAASVLIPVDLAKPLGSRPVVGLDGTPVAAVTAK